MAFGLALVPAGAWADNSTDCSVLPDSICKKTNETSLEKNGIWELLILVLNVMTAIVGLLAVAAIVFAGFLYVSAGDSTEQIKKAKVMITNTIIGVVLFGLMYALLQWLVPGGLFG
ncbi:hypothetical protein CR956_01545 [Candidatus Saccharibacteria bacterium]|nr:MAG: hypothetical protein CR956_01545 [Candidatus Saccharibacteria bacterium]